MKAVDFLRRLDQEKKCNSEFNSIPALRNQMIKEIMDAASKAEAALLLFDGKIKPAIELMSELDGEPQPG